MSGFRKKEGKKNQENRFLKYAFISGILLFLLFFLSIILSLLFVGNSEALYMISILQSVLTIIFVFYFLYGFFLIGKRYSNFLKITSILMIIFFLAFYLLSLSSPYFFGKNLMSNLDEKAKSIGFSSATEFFDYINTNPTESQKYSGFIVQEIIPAILPFLIIIISYLLIVSTLFILFGVGLIKIGKDVKYARIAGILGIIGICTMIIAIGFFVWFAAYVYMIIILFNESRKR